jgi:hypothetical protein
MAELRIEPVWHDQDLIEVRVVASNGTFAGTACVYIDMEALHAAARLLAGFPSGRADRRRIQWGGPGLGTATLDFVVIDGVGHCQVIAELHTGDQCADVPGQAATVLLSVEVAAVDRFVADLRRASERRQGTTVLECAITTRSN